MSKKNKFLRVCVLKSSAALMGISLTGCMVGPDYVKPELALPGGWKNGPLTTDSCKDEAWWVNFNDPVLTALIKKSYEQNLDIKLAITRIAEARAISDSYKSDLFPSILAGGSGQRSRNNLPMSSALKPYNVFNARLDSTWELDFFGKIQREMEATQAISQLAYEDYRKTMITLQADVAKTYITIRNLQNQIRITLDNIKIQENSLNLTQRQREAGQSNKLDVLRASSQLWSTKSQLPFYEGELARAYSQLEFLLAEQPGALLPLLSKTHPVPVMKAQLILDAPAAIVLQRPDVNEAERALAAATALQGVAIASQYPSISLSGFLGFQSSLTKNLLTSANKLWGGTGAVSLPLLTFGKIQSAINAADARHQQAFFNYKKTVLAALMEVETVLISYFKEEERRQSLEKNLHDIREAVSLAKKRYQEGLSSFLEVLDAERTLYLSESQLAQCAADVSLNLVSIYKALGGGWKSESQISLDHISSKTLKNEIP